MRRMNLKCLFLGHIPDKPEVIDNLIPFTEVHCKRCRKMYYYTTAR